MRTKWTNEEKKPLIFIKDMLNGPCRNDSVCFFLRILCNHVPFNLKQISQTIYKVVNVALFP